MANKRMNLDEITVDQNKDDLQQGDEETLDIKLYRDISVPAGESAVLIKEAEEEYRGRKVKSEGFIKESESKRILRRFASEENFFAKGDSNKVESQEQEDLLLDYAEYSEECQVIFERQDNEEEKNIDDEESRRLNVKKQSESRFHPRKIFKNLFIKHGEEKRRIKGSLNSMEDNLIAMEAHCSFMKEKQRDYESVSDWYRRLLNLGLKCPKITEQHLQDKFIFGLTNGTIKSRLILTISLIDRQSMFGTFSKAVELEREFFKEQS